MAFCAQCGNQYEGTKVFCESCGARQASNGQAPTVRQAEPTEVDQKSQLDQITPWLLPHERLYAVYDLKGAGTGFIGITNKRVLFYDTEFARKRKALTSVPCNKVTAVSAIDEGGIFRSTSELVIKTGSEAYEFEFRGGDKAQRAYRFIMAELLQGEP